MKMSELADFGGAAIALVIAGGALAISAWFIPSQLLDIAFSQPWIAGLVNIYLMGIPFAAVLEICGGVYKETMATRIVVGAYNVLMWPFAWMWRWARKIIITDKAEEIAAQPEPWKNVDYKKLMKVNCKGWRYYTNPIQCSVQEDVNKLIHREG